MKQQNGNIVNNKKRKAYDDVHNDKLTMDDLCEFIEPENFKNKKHATFISPSKLNNFMNDDCLLDYYKFQSNKKPRTKSMPYIKKPNDMDGMNLLCKKGYEFEEKIYDDLKLKYKKKFVLISDSVCDLDDKHAERTICEMKKGTPIIAQGVLKNNELKLHGFCDLLIRSDYINKIFINYPNQLTKEEETYKAPKLKGNYHYRVFDIKWTTMNLCADGIRLSNDGRGKQYKSQLLLYNVMMGINQGYIPMITYIVGKGWKYKKNNMTYMGNNCYERLGCVDYNSHNVDTIIIENTKKAIEWYRTLEQDYDKMTLYPPSHVNLYPNMCNKYDEQYHEQKYKYALSINELTLLYQVGPSNRNYALKQGICSFKDPRCNSKNLGFNENSKTGPILDNIIKVNKNNKCIFLPNKLTSFIQDWNIKTKYDFYVDFETISDCIYEDSMNINNSTHKGSFVFMIGVGYINDSNVWDFKCFYANEYNDEEEVRIFNDFEAFINLRCENTKHVTKNVPRFYHWSQAELTNIKSITDKYNDTWHAFFNGVEWIDMLNVFKLNKIAIKGSFNYGLKSVTNAMYNHKYVKNKWSADGPSDGLNAMLDAIQYYGSENKNANVMKKICDYNEIDCKAVYEIREFLINKKC